MLWRKEFRLTLVLQLEQKIHQNLCLQLEYILEPPIKTCFGTTSRSSSVLFLNIHLELMTCVSLGLGTSSIHHFLQIGATLGAGTLPNSHPSMLPSLSLVQTEQDSSCMLHDSHYKLVLFST